MNPPKGKRLGRGGALPERNTGSALLSAGTRSGRYLDYNPTPDRSGRDSIYPDRHSSRTYACQARPIRSPPRPSTLLHSDLPRPYPIRSARFRLVFTQPSYPDLIPIRPNLSDPALPNRSYPIGPALSCPILSYPVPGRLHAVSSRAPPPEPCGAGGRRPAKPPGRATRGDSGLMPETTDTQAGGRQRTLHFPHGRRPSSRDPPAVPAGVRTPYDFPQNGHPQNRIF